jgi:Cys-tRNA(Pro)/Cys-tRNA(Cys) deacylase
VGNWQYQLSVKSWPRTVTAALHRRQDSLPRASWQDARHEQGSTEKSSREGPGVPVSGGTPATTALDRAGVSYRTHSYSHDSRAESYGAEAASQLGLDPRQIFKTLIAAVDGTLVCAVIPVATRLDLKALAAAVGGRRAEMAEPAKAQRATGYVLGGISPLGHRSRIPVVVDESAAGFDRIYVSAGKRGLQLELAPADLIAVAGAGTAAIATG